MDYENFLIWLQENKNMSNRSARDVVSRLKRAMLIINTYKVTNNSLESLNSNSEFKNLSMSVKSQLRRSITLYSEFHNKILMEN